MTYLNIGAVLLYSIFKLTIGELSIEESPETSLKKLGGELTFGCHAFEKYEWSTWKQFIIKQEWENPI